MRWNLQECAPPDGFAPHYAVPGRCGRERPAGIRLLCRYVVDAGEPFGLHGAPLYRPSIPPQGAGGSGSLGAVPPDEAPGRDAYDRGRKSVLRKNRI